MEKVVEQIKEHGLKLTRPRRKIIEVLLKFKKPATLNEIHNHIRDVDFASVFRNIRLLQSLNMVTEINMGEKQPRYEMMIDDHHHHIICVKCGKIERLDVCFVEEVKLLTDYKITDHFIEFKGLCPDCQNSN